MRAAAWLVLAGCNQIFGVAETGVVDGAPDADQRPDRDHDMIADVEDPCIASPADYTSDADGDGEPNETDHCPFVQSSADDDGDGLDNPCDAFRQNPGDRRLCTMQFLDLELNASLWKARPGETDFAVASGFILGLASTPPDRTSVIAQDRIAPTTGTIVLDVIINSLQVTATTFTVWVSAGDSPSAADVGCRFVGSIDSGITAEIPGATGVTSTMGSIPPSAPPTAAIRVVIEPGKAGTNVLCIADYGDISSAKGHFDGPLGAQGFYVEQGAVRVIGMSISARDSQPSL